MTKHFDDSFKYVVGSDDTIKKYYCCTFRARSVPFNDYRYWIEVMDYHPAEYLIRCIKLSNAPARYDEYVIINTLEITKDQYNELKKLT